jgi:hypothetical protein
MGKTTVKSNFTLFSEIELSYTHNPTIPLLDISPRETLAHSHQQHAMNVPNSKINNSKSLDVSYMLTGM